MRGFCIHLPPAGQPPATISYQVSFKISTSPPPRPDVEHYVGGDILHLTLIALIQCQKTFCRT
jgi:hypothetical protein